MLAVSPARERSYQAQEVKSIYWSSVHCLQSSILGVGEKKRNKKEVTSSCVEELEMHIEEKQLKDTETKQEINCK